jgi:hypothetical protein
LRAVDERRRAPGRAVDTLERSGVEDLKRSLGEQALLRGLLLIAGAALIWIGIGFAGYAIYAALIDAAGPAWGAAVTGACLLALPLGAMTILALKQPRTQGRAEFLEAAGDKEALQLLANVAKEKPLIAVLFAGVLGAAETLRRRKG